jgi:hypothetical protein
LEGGASIRNYIAARASGPLASAVVPPFHSSHGGGHGHGHGARPTAPVSDATPSTSTAPAATVPTVTDALSSQLVTVFNQCVDDLTAFRSAHIAIVYTYIIQQGRVVEQKAAESHASGILTTKKSQTHFYAPVAAATTNPSTGHAHAHTNGEHKVAHDHHAAHAHGHNHGHGEGHSDPRATANVTQPQQLERVEVGTGGSAIMPLLKAVRDATADVSL